MHTNATSAAPARKAGLMYWAQRVIEECENASHDFAADPVHDLRVAIRRCRSMADGFLSVDPDPGWKQMKRMAKPLFASLGDLRDVQVMMEWVDKLSSVEDPARPILLLELQVRETQLKVAAQQQLGKFDRKEWLSLNTLLSARAEQIPLGGTVFQLLALERWNDARELHRRALRNRSGVAYHQLRIGIKRLRYTVENFLPALHEQWSKDLRDLQDALGEVHDFDVLWAMLRSHGEVAPAVRSDWHTTLLTERDQRLGLYRERMVGRQSLWQKWRAALPTDEQLQRAGLEKFRAWAAFLDPNFDRATQIASVAMHLYEGLSEQKVIAADRRQRCILEAAALTQEVGSSKHEKGRRKRSYKLLHSLAPPPGWSPQDMRAVAIVGRYHRGALAPASHAMFAGIAARSRMHLLRLAGVLRLANALAAAAQSSDLPLRLACSDGILTITAPDVDTGIGSAGERMARAKYLLEASCGVAIRLEKIPQPSQREKAGVRNSSPSAS
ncbi:MAG: CHAD domain-containing protein [Candidatus Korobacteraceae bacterium]